MKRQPPNNQPARRTAHSSPPILFRPTWAEAYAFRSRTITQQESPPESAPAPEVFIDAPEPEAAPHPHTGPAAIFTFSTAAQRATGRVGESGADREMPADTITCAHEATKRTAFALILILSENGAALRGQANLSERSARHLYN